MSLKTEAIFMMTNSVDCKLLRPGPEFTGKQGLNYFHGVTHENSGARGLCMHLIHVPPGARAKAHMHQNHETTLYVLSGRVRMWYGMALEKVMDCQPGDFIYIPAGVPHLPANLSNTEPATAVVARTDPNEQESVVLLPELERK
jgi:uncharacterized RmlC-like cupin family protein